MKKLLALLLLSPLGYAQETLMEYADLRFNLNFDEINKTEFLYIITKCHALSGFEEQLGIKGAKERRLEFGGYMLKSYEMIYPKLDEDDHFNLMHKETKPHYVDYLNDYNRDQDNPDLLINDGAFCHVIIDESFLK